MGPRRRRVAIPQKIQKLEFCQSQRSRFDLLEAAPIRGDRSDAEEVKDGDADAEKNHLLSSLGYKIKGEDRYHFSIEWNDGKKSLYRYNDVQRKCPCVACAEKKETKLAIDVEGKDLAEWLQQSSLEKPDAASR